jgi:cytidylate kinase
MAIERVGLRQVPLEVASFMRSESLAGKETLPKGKLKRDVYVSGPANSGKSTTIAMLRAMFDLPVEEGVGDRIKKRDANHGGAFVERNEAVDRRLDSETRKQILAADPENPRIRDARLGPYWLGQERSKRKKQIQQALRKGQTPPDEIPAVSINVWAPKETRMRRAWKDKLEREIAQGLKSSERSSLPRVKRTQGQREREDLRWWRQLYPDLKDKNPLDQSLRDPDGRPVYDLVVNTGELSPYQVAVVIFNWLKEKGFAEEIGNGVQMPPSIERNDMPTS